MVLNCLKCLLVWVLGITPATVVAAAPVSSYQEKMASTPIRADCANSFCVGQNLH